MALNMTIARSAISLLFCLSLFIGTFAQVSPLDPTYQVTTRRALIPIGPVDLLITGGTIVTMDATHQIIENGAIAVRNGEIVQHRYRRRPSWHACETNHQCRAARSSFPD